MSWYLRPCSKPSGISESPSVRISRISLLRTVSLSPLARMRVMLPGVSDLIIPVTWRPLDVIKM